MLKSQNFVKMADHVLLGADPAEMQRAMRAVTNTGSRSFRNRHVLRLTQCRLPSCPKVYIPNGWGLSSLYFVPASLAGLRGLSRNRFACRRNKEVV